MRGDIVEGENADGKVAHEPLDVDALLGTIGVALDDGHLYAWQDARAAQYRIVEWFEQEDERDGVLEGAANDISRAVGMLALVEDAQRALRELAEEVGSGGVNST